uniref:DUF223 domain-containing protein n=1 Tax=Globodera pallida TaxID=36090 RepID=A0A183C1U2_GLOPA
MYNFASGVHHQQEQPIDFVVGESVFFKFSEVLKMNKCEGVAEMMEQLTAYDVYMTQKCCHCINQQFLLNIAEVVPVYANFLHM